jgi:hypothetical protein
MHKLIFGSVDSFVCLEGPMVVENTGAAPHLPASAG